MSAAENTEITGIVNRLLDDLSTTSSSQVGVTGADLRRQIGDMRANYFVYLRDGTFAENLLAIFTTVREADAKLSSLVNVREGLFSETPIYSIPKAIVQTSIGFCLSAESRIIAAIEFKSRDSIEEVIDMMKLAFDEARDLAADNIDSSSYQNLVFLSGALINHLANKERPLPRVIDFKLATTMPALSLSNRIYFTADRWEEVVDENHIIHPAFCPREIRGLSA